MIYSTAINKILQLVNDPAGDTYGDTEYGNVAKDMFTSAICELALSAIPEDIPNLAKISSFIVSGGYISLSGLNYLKFVNLMQHPTSGQKKLVMFTQAQFARLNTEEGYKPLTDEVYWCIYFNTVRFYPISTNITVQVMYIGKPVEVYSSGYDLNNHYSLNFIYKCIELAALKIRRIIKGESS